MKLALLRHGPTEWNTLGRVQGHTDIPLSDEGLERMRRHVPPGGFERARKLSSVPWCARAQ